MSELPCWEGARRAWEARLNCHVESHAVGAARPRVSIHRRPRVIVRIEIEIEISTLARSQDDRRFVQGGEGGGRSRGDRAIRATPSRCTAARAANARAAARAVGIAAERRGGPCETCAAGAAREVVSPARCVLI